jgi:hypothetical protein
MEAKLKIICYPTTDEAPRIIPASREREWMDTTVNSFAYRCLPLNIANAHGWCVLNDAPFTAVWDGQDGLDGIKVRHSEFEGMRMTASSHFGFGILTFQVPCILRTEPDYDLWVTGPTNMFKDSIQPLSALVETDWAPSTFTMNWRFTRRDTPVAFEKDEPICMFFPIQHSLIETVDPELRPLASNRQLQNEYLGWSSSRKAFLEEVRIEGSDANRKGWEKDYFRGLTKNGLSRADNHRTKLGLKPFKTA